MTLWPRQPYRFLLPRFLSPCAPLFCRNILDGRKHQKFCLDVIVRPFWNNEQDELAEFLAGLLFDTIFDAWGRLTNHAVQDQDSFQGRHILGLLEFMLFVRHGSGNFLHSYYLKIFEKIQNKIIWYWKNSLFTKIEKKNLTNVVKNYVLNFGK